MLKRWMALLAMTVVMGATGLARAGTPSVTAGVSYTCGVKTDSTLACWGANGYGQAAPPAGTFIQISATFFTTCAVKTDGTLACWGDNTYGQAAPPAGTFTQVSAGYYNTCGVKTDGTLACWGDNHYGQTVPPAGTFTQVSTRWSHTCGVKTDGTLACWGDNTYGQAAPPAGTFTQVSAATYNTCGLKTDGTLACWGTNYYGQTAPPAGTFTQVSTGDFDTCGVKTDGTLACWGSNFQGQAAAPAGTFIQVSAGTDHTCGVKTDGSLACWGDNVSHESNTVAVLASTGGGGQNAVIGSPFATTLTVQATDYLGGHPAGVAVSFGAPSTGASAVLNAAVTDANGNAVAPATANLTAGTYLVTASVQGRTSNFTLTNTPGPQAITGFAPTTPIAYAPGGTFALSATGGGSGNAITFASTAPSVCTVSGSVATIVAVGTCTLSANQASNANYFAAPQVLASVTIAPAPQAIIGFAPTTPIIYAPGGTFALSATGGGSGNAVTFASTAPSVCTVSGSVATIVAVGTCALSANQAGNTNYTAAPQVLASVVIGAIPQTISFGVLPDRRATDPPFRVSAIGSSGQAASLQSQSPTICTVTPDGRVSLAGLLGDCSLLASVTGSATYASASASATFAVRPGPPLPPTNLACQVSLKQVSCTFAPPAPGNAQAVPAVTNYTLTCQDSAGIALPGAPFQITGTGSPLVLRGVPTGILMSCAVTANNAVGAGASSAAVYVQAKSPLAVHGGIDVDGCGRGALLLRDPVSGNSFLGRLDAQNRIVFSSTFDPGLGSRLLGSGDFGGRGKSDLLLQDVASGDTSFWIDFDGFVDNRRELRNVKPGWAVEAIADLDGDGKSDIVWRYYSTPANPSPNADDNGVVFVWFMDDAAITAVKPRGGAPVAWNLAGAADLHGSGRADLVWVSPDSAHPPREIRSITALADRNFVNESIGLTPAGYTLARMGDFDGDGKADLLFRDAAGRLLLWLMNGTQVRAQIGLPVSDPADELLAVADLNGDGAMDLVFRKPDGSLTVWLMDASAPDRPLAVIVNAAQSPPGTLAVGR